MQASYGPKCDSIHTAQQDGIGSGKEVERWWKSSGTLVECKWTESWTEVEQKHNASRLEPPPFKSMRAVPPEVPIHAALPEIAYSSVWLLVDLVNLHITSRWQEESKMAGSLLEFQNKAQLTGSDLYFNMSLTWEDCVSMIQRVLEEIWTMDEERINLTVS